MTQPMNYFVCMDTGQMRLNWSTTQMPAQAVHVSWPVLASAPSGSGSTSSDRGATHDT